MKMTKKNRIKQFLLAGNSITPKDAIERFNSYRLSAVIFDLKAEGMHIQTRMRKTNNGCTFAEYKMLRTDQSELF